jgi:hypothetical protein
LEVIAQKCRRLTALDLSRQQAIGRTALLLLLSRCSGIVDLSLADINGDAVDNDFIFTKDKPCLTLLLPRLTKLDLSSNRLVTDGLYAVAENCRQLRELRINFMNEGWIFSDHYERLATNLVHLQRIEFAAKMLQLAPTAVMFSHFQRVSVFDPVTGVLEGLPLPANILAGDPVRLKNAKKTLDYREGVAPQLWVASFAKTARCSRMSELGMRSVEGLKLLPALRSNMALLRVLRIGQSMQFTDGQLSSIASYCRLLREVEIHSAERLSDQGLTALLDANRLLTKVHLLKAVQLTDASLRALAEFCPRLRDLALQNSQLVGDAGLGLLAESCHQLSSVDLSGCSRVSGAGVSPLARHCRSLCVLHLVGCNVRRGELDCDDGEDSFSVAQRYGALD